MAKILVTGGTGMVGRALQEAVARNEHIWIFAGHRSTKLITPQGDFLADGSNLIFEEDVCKLFERHSPEYVIHLAAKVGGLQANLDKPADFFLENILMNTMVLDQARIHGVKKVVSCLSTCIYPHHPPRYPLEERSLHEGPPHDSNYAYAYVKRMLDVQSRAYRKQFGSNFITVIPNNLFGPHDNFCEKDSHVIPALIRRFYEAERNGNKIVSVWGTGKPQREFTYSKDFAQILLWALWNYDGEEPLNVGNTDKFSIKTIAHVIKHYMRFRGKIGWDDTKPDGQLKKPTDNTKFISAYCLSKKSRDYFPYTKTATALKETCEWFKKNYPNVKGVEP